MTPRLTFCAITLTLLGALLLEGCAGLFSSSDSDPGPRLIAPTVTSVTPRDKDLDTPRVKRLTATFSTQMDSSTFDSISFTATTGGIPLIGTVSMVDRTATLNLNESIPANSEVTGTISQSVKDKSGTPMNRDFVWTFTTGTRSDLDPPSVVSTEPANGAVGVPTNQRIVANFSEPIMASTMNDTTFTVHGGGARVNGTVTLNDRVATFDPDGVLALNTVYTATITTGVRDLADMPMASNYTWSFTTGLHPDSTPPRVTTTSPISGATGVPISTRVTANFSEAVMASSVNATTFTLRNAAGIVPGSVSLVDGVATFNPDGSLAYNTVYTATLTRGVRDLADNQLAAEFVWSFRTMVNTDSTPPRVTTTSPIAGAVDVSTSANVIANFNEPIMASSITETTFTLRNAAGMVPGSVSLAGDVATFNPDGVLARDTSYTATLTRGVRDVADNQLAAEFVWSFRTSAGGDSTPPQVSSTNPANGAVEVPISSNFTATFNEPMMASSINGTTFTVRSAAGATPGSVSLAGNVATFNPDGSLARDTLYTATITRGARDLADNQLAADFSWSFRTAVHGDSTPPRVTSTDPVAGATGVPINKKVVVSFTEAIKPSTLTTGTFYVESGGAKVGGTVSLIDNVATFNPDGELAHSTLYRVTITRGVRDMADNMLLAEYVFSFTTGVHPDSTAPRLMWTDPAAGATGVPTNKKITATFSESMNPSTITASTFNLKRADGTNVPATLTYANKVAVLDPTAALAANAVYTANVTRGMEDLAGNQLETAKTWTFTTAATGDSTAPTVSSTNPADGATNVFLNKSINATFSEPMRADSLNTSTFKVNGVAGTVSYDTGSQVATFKPVFDLAQNTTYTATITTGAMDSAGNRMATSKVWTFRTGVQRAQQTINLGAASTYAVLAGSTVTNAGPTVLNGDLGVSPGSAVVGFPPGRVNGSINAGNAAAASAKSDLLAGQLEASSRLGGATLPGNLSGLTFTPGLYKNSTSVQLSAGNVTLDAQGDADAVFIFQMGSTLTTSPGTQVILAGGAKATNVYWSVGTSATLGVDSIFKGVILAEVSITVNNGAVLDGTLLTKVGAVTLERNTVTMRPRR